MATDVATGTPSPAPARRRVGWLAAALAIGGLVGGLGLAGIPLVFPALLLSAVLAALAQQTLP